MEYTDNTAVMELYNVQRGSHLNLEALDIQDAQVIYPSKINEIIEVETVSVQPLLVSNNTKSEYVHKPFIEANTIQVEFNHLKNDCIIPVFSKDNEKTIAHQEFIDIVMNTALKMFPHHSIKNPEIRVSHQIKGRTPDAIYKNAKDLLDHEK
ncbi:DUF3871 family protein [Chryseobacterium sp.]|uniref:DUF3871 family protein n=1 Tax=Chryseobacterium sp. TaxID=1871047 RepID=UPI002FCBD01B